MIFRSFVRLTPELRAQLEKVQTEVNSKYPYVGDQQLYNREDYAVAITEKGGDCEDYALRKRDDLLALGWPSKSLHLAKCTIADTTGKPWGHAVMIAHTTEADLCLDSYGTNRTIKPIGEVPSNYSWKRITRPSDFPVKNGLLSFSTKIGWFWLQLQKVRRFLARVFG